MSFVRQGTFELDYTRRRRSIKSSGRYKGRQKDVAARIVNKTRRKKGETKSRRKAA